MQPDKARTWWLAGLTLLVVNSAYLWAFHPATIFYMVNVLLHLGLGLALAAGALLLWRRAPLFCVLLPGAAAGVYLTIAGNTRDHRPVLLLHILLGLAAVAVLAPWVRSHAKLGKAFAAAAILFVIVPAGSALYRREFPDASDRIRNPVRVPQSMEQEGAGAGSPFYPSSIQTNTGKPIPADFFMDSKGCGECHGEIYREWNSSAHHFASFNNQFYRKSIEYMQDVTKTQPSKWCAGCHDHAVLLNGRWDKPIREQIDTPEAQNGLGCMSCHSISHVDSSMGNGGFTITDPPLHELANSKNPYLKSVNHFLTYLAPEPHRRTFLKPFMLQDSSEFCASCHKVHLDAPVNNYRWFRGFNDYDNWQASAVSGQGARSFYYPKEASTCTGCHMPLVASHDPARTDGKVHSHRFPAANTALAVANGDREQLEATEKFLQSGFLSVDVFAVSPAASETAGTQMIRRANEAPQASSGFAVGEEAEVGGAAVVREVGQLAAPIDRSGAALQPGKTVRVDVVVRTRKVGHFFPAGTVDAFDVWLELQGRDGRGRTIFWSGRAADDGKGAVEPGAHFYRSFQLDAEGNPVNKRNAWQARTALYVRLIPPGAADVAHFRVQIPQDVEGPVTFTAKMNYRKFSWYYTHWSYAGEPKPGQDPTLLDVNHNGLEYSFLIKDIPANVSGAIKGRIPDVPIVTIAQSTASLPVGSANWKLVAGKEDRERWNDYGIGLLLQGDLKGAENAFRHATEAEPGYADGWLNVARTLIQEGENEAAKPFIARALKEDPSLGRIYYFRALIEKAEGDYDGAMQSLRVVESKYPRDRVVLNQIARILFLQRKYAEAVTTLERVCAIDPEDLQMHYTLMLCYRGLQDREKAAREEKLFRRFKAEESAQAITAKVRMQSPEDNNERQSIHDHTNAQ